MATLITIPLMVDGGIGAATESTNVVWALIAAFACVGLWREFALAPCSSVSHLPTLLAENLGLSKTLLRNAEQNCAETCLTLRSNCAALLVVWVDTALLHR
jgi:hypothetical protein